MIFSKQLQEGRQIEQEKKTGQLIFDDEAIMLNF